MGVLYNYNQQMKLISWNVNSIRARQPLVEELIKKHQPDILFLQETKCINEQFPSEVFEDLGYNLELHGQKTFNGVAILSKFPFEKDVIKNIPTFDDEQARYIEVSINGSLFINVYIPNGQDPASDKYIYKLIFLEKLYEHLKKRIKQQTPFVLAGDFNIALTKEDIAFPDENMICFTPKERQKLNQIISLGLIDVQHYKNISGYTWWDYRNLGFAKNEGMRLDYIFISPDLLNDKENFSIDVDFRKMAKTSDHAPLIISF